MTMTTEQRFMTDGDEAPLKRLADVPPWPRAPESGLREETVPLLRLLMQPRYFG